ncbi:MAG TPA: FIST N-terminal domain-containing protein [Acidimicrobiales bacterium]|nr:FIST N-terminal domain-containing protein [Acidimicrobiales bacterium]
MPKTASSIDRRWAGAGASTDADSFRAGAAAAAQACGGRRASALIAFVADGHDLDALVAGVSEAAPGVPLVGCTTAGEITSSSAGSTGVVVFALGGDGFATSSGVATSASRDLRAAGAKAAGAALARCNGEHRVLMLLTDGLAGDQQEVVRGAYSVAGAGVPLVGGCAGDDLRMQGTRQIHRQRVLTDSVVALAIGSDAPIGIGVRHGWQKVGEPMVVTRAAGVRVQSLDDRPALDVYLERLAPPAKAFCDPAAFTQFALTHPLGLERRGGEAIRFVAGADFERRELVCIAEVPEGGLAYLMEGDADSVLSAADDACRDALDQLEGRPALGLLAFDCIARRGILGEEGLGQEVVRLAANSSGAPLAGFYTYGEFARTQGVSGFHNQTLVVLALS